MSSLIKICLCLLSLIIIILIVSFFVGNSKANEDITWGVNFSQKQTDFLKIDFKETYSALIEDLKFKNIKISVHWDLIEKEEGIYDFSDLDWMIEKAKENDVKIILAVGMRTPRWPECHLPSWIRNLNKEEQQEEILKMLEKVISRYKDSSTISSWQVENEVFLNFGACPWTDEDFFKKEIAFVKKIDKTRPIIATDSGELSMWMRISQVGADVLGVTTYRKVWQNNLETYVSYPLPAIFYERRTKLVSDLFNKEVIGTELQAEPWCANSIINASIEEQEETMSLSQFKENVEFAKKTGIKTFYFWGGEWWYYMKNIHNNSQIWDEVKKILNK